MVLEVPESRGFPWILEVQKDQVIPVSQVLQELLVLLEIHVLQSVLAIRVVQQRLCLL